ncbi:hypothetical protein [Kribbella sp. VKM Ac-2566]|uniref:hypothetical protein n=1 Tax=Kribbella sp. VKM Ac-2566 TaxID=2512218 RepID=UPI001062BD13|nr:hypothetical protein [Kribbella sp. VKM Ac-2566]TDW98553.1 hypothetical protein EV647_3273 [Kribbella sp. VKM Ac-2566]
MAVTATELAHRPALLVDPDALDVIGGGTPLGYAGVPTRDQNLHRQFDALTATGCNKAMESAGVRHLRLSASHRRRQSHPHSGAAPSRSCGTWQSSGD